MEFPEIAVLKIDRQTGVSELALRARGRENGALLASTRAEWGRSHLRRYVVLLASWMGSDPGAPKPGR